MEIEKSINRKKYPTIKNAFMSETISAAEFRQLYAQGAQQPAKKSKYNATKTKVADITFDSKKESIRYGDLKSMEKANEITGLQLQVKFKLEGTSYVADFVYYCYSRKDWIVEDVKGMRTSLYRNKKKAMKERYNIEIQEK